MQPTETAAGFNEVQHAVAPDHPVFAGHFPGQPLMPGALLLAEVIEAAAGIAWIAERLGSKPLLAAAKFLAPVRPGDLLDIRFHAEVAPAKGVRFEVGCGAVVCASGRWLPAAAPVVAPQNLIF